MPNNQGITPYLGYTVHKKKSNLSPNTKPSNAVASVSYKKAGTSGAGVPKGFFNYGGSWYFRNQFGNYAKATKPTGSEKVIKAPAGFKGLTAPQVPRSPTNAPPSSPGGSQALPQFNWGDLISAVNQPQSSDVIQQYDTQRGQLQSAIDSLSDLKLFNKYLDQRKRQLEIDKERQYADLARRGAIASGDTETFMSQLGNAFREDEDSLDREFGNQKIRELTRDRDAVDVARQSILDAMSRGGFGQLQGSEPDAGAVAASEVTQAAEQAAKKYLAGLFRNALGAVQFRSNTGGLANTSIRPEVNDAINKAWTSVKKTKKGKEFTIPGYAGTYFMNESGSLARKA